jgi:catechol 2,3-dioxygenase-like lactoylglutathione lyase family enzyme
VPETRGLLEAALYVEDMDRAVAFFAGVLGFRCMDAGSRLSAFDLGRSGVLLLCTRGASRTDLISDGGVIPGHDGFGPQHIAFAIEADGYASWRAHLQSRGVMIRSEVVWPSGARSLYFEDPDGHILEFATVGVWPNSPGLSARW